jgi:outer membrane protein TolC
VIAHVPFAGTLRKRLLHVFVFVATLCAPRAARADGSSLEAAEPAPLARTTIRVHQYTLEECLALADRNFPNLWAARARLAFAHAQLEEARWVPWSFWYASSNFGVAPPLLGTVLFPVSSSGPSTQASKNITGLGDLQPFVTFNLTGSVPLYTFGKISAALDAAEANVRFNEWDMEKWRQTTRMDVRRAYYGLQTARDGKYIADDALDRISKAISGIKDRLARGETNVDEVDRLSLETQREEIVAQSLQVTKNEAYGLAALRFLTGVETSFEIVDAPLRRPDRPLVAIVQYLEAARLLRPDVNMARAGIAARKALVDLARARLFPDLGLGLSADFASTPSAVVQNNLWASDSFNHFIYLIGFGVRWSLDLLPQAARTRQAESQLEETRALERLALGNAEFEVERAYAEAVEAKGREEAWDRAEHLAKQWISNVQDHIDLGTWDERALLLPLRSYLNARVQHLTALMDRNLTLSNLAMVSGWDSAAP